jgi:hypothetical protein
MTWLTRFVLKRWKRKLEAIVVTSRYETELSRKLDCVQYLLDRR